MNWRGGIIQNGSGAATKMKGLIKLALLLAIVSSCLFGYVLNSNSGVFREFQAALLSLQWMLLACLSIWCGTFIFLTFRWEDWPLLVLLLIALTAYFIGYTVSRPVLDAIILVFGVTLGKGAHFALEVDCRQLAGHENVPEIVNRKSAIVNFLVGLVALLAFASWWHLDMSDNFYHGPRWMGLWNNPNIYGMLMGAGVVLTAELLFVNRRWKMEDGIQKRNLFSIVTDLKFAVRHLPSAILWVGGAMLGVGLVMSYSRGAGLGTAIGLLYLAMHTKAESGKQKAKIICYLLPLMALAAAVVLLCWDRTPDSAPWFIKRADLARPSAQHRVAAWKAGFEIMRDHPFGVGWNKTVETYDKYYSPPEGGAAAITTNDYLMIGTQLGIPALICFLAYVALCFRTNCRSAAVAAAGCASVSPPAETQAGTTVAPADETSGLRVACLSGALAMLVAFWFDGGLFKLPTAALFWVLLELGSQVPKPFCPTQPALLNNSTETSGAMTENSQRQS